MAVMVSGNFSWYKASMTYRYFAAAALGLMFASPTAAQNRGWDASRYDRCLRVTGSDPLDRDHMFNAIDCRASRDPVEDSENDPGDTTVRVFAVGAVNKANREQAFVALSFGTRLERTDTAIGGTRLTSNGSGGLGHRMVTTLIGGQVAELRLEDTGGAAPSCRYLQRGGLAGRICSYVESSMAELPASLLDEVATTYVTDPSAVVRFKLFTDVGANYTVTVPAAEIEAVRLRVNAATAP